MDSDRNNLIVVATNSMSLGSVKEAFASAKHMKRHAIARVVHKVLGILNVRIVFIENNRDAFNIEKLGDFHRFPDGEWSPYNLFEVLCDQLKSNEDYLGSTIISHYFSTACKERSNRAKHLGELEPSEYDSEGKINALSSLAEEVLINVSYRYLGRGYSIPIDCPISCPIYCISKESDTNSPLTPATYFVMQNESGTSFPQMSFPTKELYEGNRNAKLGLTSEIQCNIGSYVTSLGKWYEDAQLKGNECYILSFLYEIRSKRVVLDRSLRSHLIDYLRDDINKLPDSLTKGWLTWMGSFVRTPPETNDVYDSFFDKWGTHFINEISIGGSIRVDCCMKRRSTDPAENKRSYERLQERVKKILTGGPANNVFSLTQDVEIEYSIVEFRGGNPPGVEDLRNLTPEIISQWKASIEGREVELVETKVLKPYHDLVETETKKLTFKNAMLKYLKNYGNKDSVIRNVEALREENTSMMFASTWVSENKWRIGTVLAATVAVSAAVTAGPEIVLTAFIMMNWGRRLFNS